ncbi:MAG: hypothetical protein CMK09_11225 [Ponticaulis sp.]|nr:hypothetical protein [Ponticaulis sp.]|tara:strand:- start:8684 stop:8971 length:288 start_codon:yes stop_codon:yes gene_type:complete
MLNLFRIIALIEGVTTLALFLVAMPMKYAFGNPALVPPVGMSHGVAWMAYVVAMPLCLSGVSMPAFGWVRTFIAALFPFGTFLNDPFLKRMGQKA